MMLTLASLDTRTNVGFKRKTGLPLVSSPVPFRKSLSTATNCFTLEESLDSVKAIKKALFEKELTATSTTSNKCTQISSSNSNNKRQAPSKGNGLLSSPCHLQKAPRCWSPVPQVTSSARSSSKPSPIGPLFGSKNGGLLSITSRNLLGNFEESMLKGRLKPVNAVSGFTVEVAASGSFCPNHRKLPATAYFYSIEDLDRVTAPYMGHVSLGRKGYRVPKKGTVQFTLFNPLGTVVKMFVLQYDFSDMPPNSQTFLRQRTYYMPTDASEHDADARKCLRYLIHLRFATSKSGRLYVHNNARMIIWRKSDFDASAGGRKYDYREFIQGPSNPRYSSRA